MRRLQGQWWLSVRHVAGAALCGAVALRVARAVLVPWDQLFLRGRILWRGLAAAGGIYLGQMSGSAALPVLSLVLTGITCGLPGSGSG